MQLRPAEQKDIIRLISMSEFFAYSPFLFDPPLEKDQPLEPLFAAQMLRRPDTQTLVLEDEDIRGYISFSYNPGLSAPTGYKIANILLLVVHPQYQGRGLGRFMVRSALDYLRTLKIDLVMVGTDLYNIPAINCYEQNGFQCRMSWHIFRYKMTPGSGKYSDSVDAVDGVHLDDFYDAFERPLSLLRENKIQSEPLRRDIFNRLKNKIEQNSAQLLGLYRNDRIQGVLVYQKDLLSQKSLSLQQPVYRISDLMVENLPDEQDEIMQEMLSDIIIRMGQYAFIEYWVESTQIEKIHALEKAGFQLSYTGLNLHYWFT